MVISLRAVYAVLIAAVAFKAIDAAKEHVDSKQS